MPNNDDELMMMPSSYVTKSSSQIDRSISPSIKAFE